MNTPLAWPGNHHYNLPVKALSGSGVTHGRAEKFVPDVITKREHRENR
jgi:hypothetical protein